jgi:hypothetical protein
MVIRVTSADGRYYANALMLKTVQTDTNPYVYFESTSSRGDESVTAVNITVSLSEVSTQVVTVDYAVTGGTAAGGGIDYTLSAGTVTFSPGETSKTISLEIIDDSDIENDETIEITLSNPVNALLGTNTLHTYTIEDNDGIVFTAYNDLSWSDPQINTNITTYTTGQSGELVDYTTGSSTGVTLTIEGGFVNSTTLTQGADADAGTDAYDVFNGIVDGTGVISYDDLADLVFTFTGLDPNQKYEFVLFGNRANPAYTDRMTTATIEDVDGFTNNSSTGADFTDSADPSVTINNGYNTVNGYIARFTNIKPGADGDMVIRVTSPSSPYRYYANALMLKAKYDQFTLTVTKDGTGTGTVTTDVGNIDCGTTCSDTYDYGTVVTLTATPAADSTFTGWSGDADCSDGQVTMNTDVNCTATFAINQYTITATAGANGSINPSGTVTVSHGDNQDFTITPDTGYHVADVVVDGSSVGAVTSYTFTNVTADHTIEASFEINQYTITTTVTGNGTLTCDSPVDYNGSSTCTVAPDPGYHLVSLIDNGVDVTASVSNGQYTIANVTEDHTVEATFAINQYTVTPSVGSGSGTISPDTQQTVNHGGSVQFTLTPATGYHIDSVSGTCGGTLNGSTFTTDAVTSDCTVVANFAIDTLTVSPSVGSGQGTIAPDTSQTVNYGDTISFTLTPGTGYHIDSVSGTCSGTLNGNTFTTNAITSDCTVVANFAIDTFTITTSVTGSGTLTCDSPVNYNDTSTCTITPDSGYHLATLTDNGVDVTGSVSSGEYTISNVTENHTIEATFEVNNNPPSVPKLIYPINGEIVDPTSVTFKWEASSDPDGDTIEYELYYCEDPDFTNCTQQKITTAKTEKVIYAGIGGLGAGLMLFGAMFSGDISRRRKILLLIAGMILSLSLLTSCGGGGGGGGSSSGGNTSSKNEVTYTVTDLNPGTTYYWKVVAVDSNGGSSASATGEFNTR